MSCTFMDIRSDNHLTSYPMSLYHKHLRVEAIILLSLFLFSFFPNENNLIEKDPSPSQKISLSSFSHGEQPGFIENKGQLRNGNEVAYYIQQESLGIYLKKTGIRYVWKKEVTSIDSSETRGLTQFPHYTYKYLDMNWEGSNPNVKIQATHARSDLRHFYTSGTTEGLTHVHNFGEIYYEELFPGIDMRLYFKGSQLKYDFIVKAGGKVSDIRMCYSGQDTMLNRPDGSIQIQHPWGSLEEGRPYSYQVLAGDTAFVSSRYQLQNGVIQFKVNKYDERESLVIDPTLEWATYYGGADTERANAVYTDDQGNVYMAGTVRNEIGHGSYSDFEHEGHDNSPNGPNDAFLVKFAPNGSRLWATFYGGDGEEKGWSVCTDPFDNVYLAGTTSSGTDIAENGHDEIYNEVGTNDGNRFNRDAFLVKFSEDGIRLWATYYGGEESQGFGDSRSEDGMAVCTDSDGHVFLTGNTTSEQYIASDGHDNSFNGNRDAFLVKFDPNGNREWGTYFGGSEVDGAEAIASDDWGNVYIAGFTNSHGLATQALHDDTYSGDYDGFLAKFSPEGKLYWCNYIGGTELDRAHSIAIDNGYVYVAGMTRSQNGIAKKGHDITYNGGIDAFLMQFGFLGNLLWGTYYGGAEDDGIIVNTGTGDNYWRTNSVRVSPNSQVYLAGATRSGSHIATNNGYDPTHNGDTDGFLVRFLRNGDRQWGTYFGGEASDYIMACAVDSWSNVYITGGTRSPSGIALNGHDNTFNDSESHVYTDAFLAKFGPELPPEEEPDSPQDSEPSPDPRSNRTAITDLGTKLYIYPNPTQDQVHIFLPNSREEDHQLIVQDLQGKTLYHQSGLKGSIKQKIALPKLPVGIYVVSIQSESSTFSEKLLIQ